MCHPGAGKRAGDAIAAARRDEADVLRAVSVSDMAAQRGLAFARLTRGRSLGNQGLEGRFMEARPLLRRLLAARLGSPDEAEDALQDLWLRVSGLDAGQIEQPIPFLCRMATNMATDRVSPRRGAACGTARGKRCSRNPPNMPIPNGSRRAAASWPRPMR